MKFQFKKMKTTAALCIGLLLIVMISYFLVDVLSGAMSRPTADDRTLKVINDMSRLLGTYYNSHGVLPDKPDDAIGGSLMVDVWGNQIVYEDCRNGFYVLRSYGRDKVKSRDDIARQFRAGDITTESSMAIP